MLFTKFESLTPLCLFRWWVDSWTSVSSRLWIKPSAWSFPKCLRRSSAISYQNSKPGVSRRCSFTRSESPPSSRTQCLKHPNHPLTPTPPETAEQSEREAQGGWGAGQYATQHRTSRLTRIQWSRRKRRVIKRGSKKLTNGWTVELRNRESHR